jgi:hypothetical protein
MKDKGRIALSSLAVSVSAAALLGVSGVASGEDQTENCWVGPACSLGWWEPYKGVIYGPGVEGWHALPPEVEAYVTQLAEYEASGYWANGACQLREQPPYGDWTCGCGGWTWADYLVVWNDGQYWYVQPTQQAVDHFIPSASCVLGT